MRLKRPRACRCVTESGKLGQLRRATGRRRRRGAHLDAARRRIGQEAAGAPRAGGGHQQLHAAFAEVAQAAQRRWACGVLALGGSGGRLAGGATRAPCSTRCAELQVGERRLFRTGKKRLGNEPSLRHEAVGWEPSAALWRSWAPWQAARAHHDALTPHLSIASRLDSWRVNQRGTPSQTTGKSNRTFETPITRFVCRQINLQIHTRGARDRSAKLQSKAWLQ